MARLSAWTIGLVLAFFGSQAAHALTYAAVTPDPEQRAAALQQSGHAYLSYLPFAFGLLGAVAALGLASRLVVTERPASPLGWPVALLPLVTFVVQEHLERIDQQGAFPWHAALEPTFLPGVLLQLPLGVVAYVVARALLRGADRFAGLLRSPARRLPGQPPAALGGVPTEIPPRGARARATAARGPPALVAA